MSNIKQLLKQKKKIIDQTLQELMNNCHPPLAETLQEAMEYSLFSGGKRIRPILTELVTEMLGGDRDAARICGSAIELIHTYSLIHDDLPSMDDDDLRRGEPTNHKIYGPGIAILAGDGLLTYAFNLLSTVKIKPENKIEIIKLVSQGAGVAGMVGGQVLDLEAEEKELNLEELKTVHRAKTGGLFRASILSGAYCSDTTKNEIKALTNYADNLGLLFQVTDDILDVTGDTEKLGKSTGQDQRLNKSTYPSLLGIDGARKEAERLAERARENLEKFGERASILRQLVDFILTRQY